MVPLVGMIKTGLLFLLFAGWYFWPARGVTIVYEASSPSVEPAVSPLTEEDAKRRSEIIRGLREEYKHTDGACVLTEGEFPPNDWMNKRLKEKIENTTFFSVTQFDRKRSKVNMNSPITKLNNAELRESAISFAMKMRTFANNAMSSMTELSSTPYDGQGSKIENSCV